MRRMTWVAEITLLVAGLAAAVILVPMQVHLQRLHQEGERAMMDAVARMENVSDRSDMTVLLSACNSGGAEVSCRQTDYDVLYRGHHMLASNIAIDYHRAMHDRWDTVTQTYLPYMTGNVHIERQPQIQYFGWVTN